MSLATMSVSLQINAEKLNVVNICVSNISATDITSTDGNISYLFGETFYPNYIAGVGAEFSDIVNFSSINTCKINNSFSTVDTALPLTLYSVSNNVSTGLRVPTYVDSQDLGQLTLGYNQTTGFINVCRATRFYSNILTDSNINGINATDSITFGNNITTGNLRIGNSTMTGNISIQTAGDLIFECDRRSTWNTSGIIASSTQLGSYYQQTASSSTTKTNTGQTFVFSPVNANTSLTTVPVGLYLVSATGYARTAGGYNASITAFNIGTCYGGTYNFTSATTTRVAFQALAAMNTSGTTDQYWTIGFTGIVNMSATGNYIGAFASITAAQAATTGSIFLVISNCTVVKIA
jgi:hypothetical protein